MPTDPQQPAAALKRKLSRKKKKQQTRAAVRQAPPTPPAPQPPTPVRQAETNKCPDIPVVGPAVPTPAVAPVKKKHPATPLWLHLLAAAVISLATVPPYLTTFTTPFLLDDSINFAENQATLISDLSLESLRKAATDTPNSRRWLPNISFALHYYFHKHDLWGYHLVNLLIHIGSGILIYMLFYCSLGYVRPPTETTRLRFEIALAGSLLWLLHPLQINAVTYIVQRMTSMAAMFCLSSLLCYILARQSRSLGIRIIFFTAALLAAAMALCSKENSLMLPFLLGAYEVYFLRSRQALSRKNLLGGLAVGAALTAVAVVVLLGKGIFVSMLSGYAARDFTLIERLLTESRIMYLYLSLLILPLPGKFSLAHDITLSTGLFSPIQTVLAIGGLLGLVVLAIYLFRRDRLLSFALFWFFANMVIESTVYPLELIFEHRMYFPSIFLFLAGARFFYTLSGTRIYPARIVVLLLIPVLGLFTWQRNQVWQDQVTLWGDAIAKSPHNARAYNNLAEGYVKKNDFLKAKENYLRALQNSPSLSAEQTIRRNLGFAHIVFGEYDQAEKQLLASLRIDPKDPKTHLNLGIVYKKKNMMDKSRYHYAQARSGRANLFGSPVPGSSSSGMPPNHP